MRWWSVRNYSNNAIPRWFRAVDVAEWKPGFYGYEPTRKARQFEPFAWRDSQRLETAYKHRPQRQTAAVETDGLFTVDFKAMQVRPTFWEGPRFAVRRCVWLEVLGTSSGTTKTKKIAPIPPEIEQIVETHFQTRPTELLDLDWPADTEGSASKTRMQGRFNLEQDPPTLVLQDKRAWLAPFTKRTLSRGIPESHAAAGTQQRYKAVTAAATATAATATAAAMMKVAPNVPDGTQVAEKGSNLVESANTNVSSGVFGVSGARPEFRYRPIRHLVFCVHGIGQLLSVRFEQVNFVKDVDALRTAMRTTFTKIHSSSGEPPPPDSGVQVLPVMWRQQLDDRISGLRPHDLFGTTNLAADAVLDFVMYTAPAQRRLVQRAAATEMNRMYAAFCEAHPEFRVSPRVSVIGHSLGSVIAYDLLHRESAMAELEFDVTNLFTLGSPVGVLDLITRGRGGITRGSAAALYNIMRHADPVAARLEPLVARDSLNVPPKPLPGGGTNLIQQVRELTGDLASQGEALTNRAARLFDFILSKPADSTETSSIETKPTSAPPPSKKEVDLSPLKQFNRHGRLDFSVQETIDLSLFLGLAGHLMYLDNPDVVQFILKELLELPQEPN